MANLPLVTINRLPLRPSSYVVIARQIGGNPWPRIVRKHYAGAPRETLTMYTYISTNKREYKLCKSKIILRGGKEAEVFYFIGPNQLLKKGTLYANEMPKGFEVRETRSGHPLVAKSRN